MYKKLIYFAFILAVAFFALSTTYAVEIGEPPVEIGEPDDSQNIELQADQPNPPQPGGNNQNHSVLEEVTAKELQAFKDEFIHSCSKSYMKEDENRYKTTLEIGNKMLGPILKGKKLVKGGYTRVTDGIEILNGLREIHQNEEYCSQDKENALSDLEKRAEAKLDILENSPKISLEFRPAVEESTPLNSFKHELLTKPINISAVGGRATVGLGIGVGFGASLGDTKDLCGNRKGTFFGEVVGQTETFIVSFSGGYWDKPNAKAKKTYKAFRAAHGFLVGITSPTKKFMTGTTCHDYGGGSSQNVRCGEFALGVFIWQFTASLGGMVTLFPLPQDVNYFRENIGIRADNGKLPKDLLDEIEKATSIQEVKNIHIADYKEV